MNKKINEIKKILNDITSYKGVPVRDIPDIALYMDQVTTFMDRKLESFKRREEDKILTKTMINNYTKAGLIFPPKMKKYDKEHIMLLTIIYHLKQILSVNDMGKLLTPVIGFIERPDEEDEQHRVAAELYSIFTEMEIGQLLIFEESVDNLLKSLSGKSALKNISDNDSGFLIIFIVSLIMQAELRKNLAEKLIDKYFTPKPPEKKKEVEKTKEKEKSRDKKK